jgi:DNA-binding GntR family transcriptional regulator
MPVRSALMRLQALQALKAQPNGTMKLPDMTRDHFSELMEARRVVEGGATELAAQHVNGNKLRTIKRHCDQLTKAARNQDINSYLLNNYSFKFSIYNCCGCQPLIFLIETLWMQAGPFLRNFAGKFDGDLSGILEIDYHEDALAALEVGDGKRAAEAIRRDIAEGRTYLLKYARFSAG